MYSIGHARWCCALLWHQTILRCFVGAPCVGTPALIKAVVPSDEWGCCDFPLSAWKIAPLLEKLNIAGVVSPPRTQLLHTVLKSIWFDRNNIQTAEWIKIPESLYVWEPNAIDPKVWPATLSCASRSHFQAKLFSCILPSKQSSCEDSQVNSVYKEVSWFVSCKRDHPDLIWPLHTNKVDGEYRQTGCEAHFLNSTI